MKKIFLIGLIWGMVLSVVYFSPAKAETVIFPSELTGDQLYEQGLSLSNQEKYQDAIPCFEEAVKRKSNFGEAYYQLGVCYLQVKQFDKANQTLIMARILAQDKNLKDKAKFMIARIPEEIEKEKKAKEDELRKKKYEEYQVKREVEAKEKQAKEKQAKEKKLAEERAKIQDREDFLNRQELYVVNPNNTSQNSYPPGPGWKQGVLVGEYTRTSRNKIEVWRGGRITSTVIGSGVGIQRNSGVFGPMRGLGGY